VSEENIENEGPTETEATEGDQDGIFEEIEQGEGETVIENLVGEQLETSDEGRNIDAMLNIGLNVQVVLGQSRMPISQLLKLSRGAVIELDKKIGEPVGVVINDRLVARGDLVKIGGDRLGVTLTEIVKDYVSER